MEEEIWKAIPGEEGKYSASNLGNIRSERRVIIRSNGAPYSIKGGVLSPGKVDKWGYLHVALSGGVAALVHRIVMATFVGPCPEGMVVCHIDGDASNNRLDNLMYGTCSENELHKEGHGTNYQRNKTHCPRGHELTEPNLTRDSMEKGFRSCASCSRAYTRLYCRKPKGVPPSEPEWKNMSDMIYSQKGLGAPIDTEHERETKK